MRPREATRGNLFDGCGPLLDQVVASMRPREATRGNVNRQSLRGAAVQCFNEAAGSYPRKPAGGDGDTGQAPALQ